MLNDYVSLVDGGGTGKSFGPYNKARETICTYCNLPALRHLRCKTCRILIHRESFLCYCGMAHTLSLNGSECTSCQINKVDDPNNRNEMIIKELIEKLDALGQNKRVSLASNGSLDTVFDEVCVEQLDGKVVLFGLEGSEDF